MQQPSAIVHAVRGTVNSAAIYIPLLEGPLVRIYANDGDVRVLNL